MAERYRLRHVFFYNRPPTSVSDLPDEPIQVLSKWLSLQIS